MTYLLRVGAYFWFDPSQRRAYTSQGQHQATHDRTRKRDAEGALMWAPQQLQRENPYGYSRSTQTLPRSLGTSPFSHAID